LRLVINQQIFDMIDT